LSSSPRQMITYALTYGQVHSHLPTCYKQDGICAQTVHL